MNAKAVSHQLFQDITERARRLQKTVALPESFDPRVLHAAHELAVRGLVGNVLLFGETDRIQAEAKALGIDWTKVRERWRCVNSETYVDLEKELVQFRRAHLLAKGRPASEDDLHRIAASPLFQAGYLLKKGDAHAVVAGCVATTAEVIRAALQTVGTAKGIETVSGSFLMTRTRENGKTETFVFGDCGVVIDPTAQQLVDIAEASVMTFQSVCPDVEPRVAFLSFSTKGSAAHPHVEKVAQAAAMFRARCPEVASDGELQFDAAYVPAVGQKKAPESEVAGRANCFIFPDLNAGNIAYKITQRLGGFDAIGPLLQGTAKPFSDLSRGASVDDIVMAACISSLRGDASI